MKTSSLTRKTSLLLTALLMTAFGLLFSMQAQATCKATAGFKYSNSSNGLVYASNASSTTSGTYYSKWNFGDGKTSSAKSPTHTFAKNGVYHICLTVIDSIDTTCTNTYCVYDTVKTYSCSAYMYDAVSGLSVVLTDSNSSAVNSGHKRSAVWSYGDGSSNGSGDATTHKYAKTGTYTVCVTVYDSVTACSSQDCKSIYVTNCSLTASYSYSHSGSKYTFTNTSSTSGHTKYTWNFGDGSKYDSTSGKSASHTYTTSSSTVNVTLVIYDSTTGCTAYVTQTITLCAAKSDFTSKASGLSVSFTSDSTNTSKGLTYSWSYGDKTTNGTAKNPTHTYGANGTYNVCLTVNDTINSCSSTTCNNVTVSNCSLTASFIDSISGHTVKFYGTTNASSHSTITWIFGDGTSDSTSGKNTHHTYSSSVSSETVYMRVYDSTTKCLTYYSKTITFCTALSDYTYSVSGLTVSFTSDSKNKSTARYSWDFNDKKGSTSANPSHTYAAGGTYNVCLTVTDSSSGCSSTTCQSITLCTLTASFTDSVSSHTVYFYGKTNASSHDKITWIFGDGSSDSTSGLKTHHTYSSSVASETVYMRVYDSTTKCLYYSYATITFCAAKSDFTYAVSGLSAAVKSDASNGKNVSYYWSFGDGTYSRLSALGHTYSKAGTYNVCLTATDSTTGCNTTTCNNITVTGCTLSASFTDSTSGRTVKFFGTTNGSSHLKVTWSFGDGSSDSTSGLTTHHTYTASGDSFMVYMRIYDSTTKCVTYAYKEVHVTCTALSDYTYSVSGLSVSFTSDSKNGSGAKFVWDFNDKSSSTSANPTHTYSTSGTYNVCLTVTDNGCSTTTCHSITVSGCSLTASFTDSIAGHKVKFFGTTNGSSHLKVTWIFGDGSTDSTSGLKTTHTYGSSVTTEKVYMRVYDSTTKCVVYASETLTFCNLSAKWSYTVSGSTVKFVGDSTNPSGTSYIWIFGDKTSNGTGRTVNHTYSTSGTYRVCLYALDSPCAAEVCDSITIATTYCISGQVITGKTAGYPALVYLITYNPKDSSLKAIDSTTTDTLGNYKFCGLKNGTYYTKAALTTKNPYYKYFIPTYHYDATRWSSASSIVVNNADETGEDINMKKGTNSGGAGFIGGKISAGANKTGDPEANVLVIVYDANGDASAYTYSNASGYYSLSGLEFGTYTVEGEIPGKVCYPATVTLTDTSSTDNSVDLLVNSTTVTAAIKPIGNWDVASIKVFPNPVSDKMNLNLNLSHSSQANIRIYDMTGKLVSETNTTIGAGAQTYQVDATALPSGLYSMRIQLLNDNSLLEARFVKAR